MKNHPHCLSLILTACLALALAGCANQPTPQALASYIADARDIAELGARAAMLEKPDLRPQIQTTQTALAALASLPDGQITADNLIGVLSTLPIAELQSDKGKIYVTAGRIIVRRFLGFLNNPEIDVAASGYVRQFAGAIADGLAAGLK